MRPGHRDGSTLVVRTSSKDKAQLVEVPKWWAEHLGYEEPRLAIEETIEMLAPEVEHKSGSVIGSDWLYQLRDDAHKCNNTLIPE